MLIFANSGEGHDVPIFKTKIDIVNIRLISYQWVRYSTYTQILVSEAK